MTDTKFTVSMHPTLVDGLDEGFSPVVNDDLPASTDMFSAVPFSGAGDPGTSGAPWHGTQVASAYGGDGESFACSETFVE